MARSKEKLPRDLLKPLPRREELEALARHYHHLENEHKRAAVESSTRRRIEERLLDVRERFDRLLEDWVPEEELRRAWREHLHNRAPMPSGPPAIRPLLFYGVTDAGSVVEVRGKKDEELEVRVDGTLTERVVAEKDLSSVTPPLSFRVDGIEAHETFTASPEAARRPGRLPRRRETAAVGSRRGAALRRADRRAFRADATWAAGACKPSTRPGIGLGARPQAGSSSALRTRSNPAAASTPASTRRHIQPCPLSGSASSSGLPIEAKIRAVSKAPLLDLIVVALDVGPEVREVRAQPALDGLEPRVLGITVRVDPAELEQVVLCRHFYRRERRDSNPRPPA